MASSAKDGTIKMNKAAMALKGIAGIDIYSDKKNGKIKSMMQLLDELHPKWKTLRDDQRAALSEAIAGKHRANVFQALMQNYGTLDKIRGQFNKGEHFGSAETENAKFVNSFRGKVNVLKETLTSIATLLVNNKSIYGFLDVINSGVGGLEKLVKFSDKYNAQIPLMLSGIIGLRNAFKGFSKQLISYEDIENGVTSKKNGFFGGIFSKKDKGKEKILTTKKGKEYETPLIVGSDSKLDKNYQMSDSIENEIRHNREKEKNNETRTKEAKGINTINEERKKSNEHLKEATSETKKNTKGIEDSSLKVKGQTKALAESSKAFNGSIGILESGKAKLSNFGDKAKTVLKGFASGVLSGALSMGASAIAMYGVQKVLEVGIGWYNKQRHGIEIDKESHLKSRDVLLQENKAIQSNIDYVKENEKAINSLYQRKMAIERIPEKNLTDENKRELEEIKRMESRLAKISPSSVVGYDKNGDPIIKANASAKEYLKSLELVKNQKKEALKRADNTLYDDNIRKIKYGNNFGESTLDNISKFNKNIKSNFAYSGANTKSSLGVSLGSYKDFRNYFDDYNRILNEFTASKKIGDASQKFKKEMGAWRKAVNEEFKGLKKAVDEYDKFNNENSKIQMTNVADDKRFNGLSKAKQESTLGLASVFQWGKIENPAYATDMLYKLTQKVNPDKLNGIVRSINDLNQAYQVDRDYSTYSQGIDKLVNSLSKVSGLNSSDINKFKNYIKDVERGHDSIESMWEANYMKAHGAKNSDLLKDDSASAYAQRVKVQYNAIKEAHTQFENATTKEERLSAVKFYAENENITKGQRAFAKAIVSSGNVSDGALSFFEKMIRTLMQVDSNSDKARKNLDGLFESIGKNDISKASEFGKFFGLNDDDITGAMGSGVNKTNLSEILEEINSQAYKNIDDFYSSYKNSEGKALEIPLDVKMVIADNGLTDNDIKGLESFIDDKKFNTDVANQFRKSASKFFEGTGGDVDLAFKEMAESTEGIRTALNFGMESNLIPYNQEIEKLANGYHNLTDAMRESAKAMSDEDFKSYIDNFNGLNDGLKNIAKKYNVNNSEGLSSLDSAYNSFVKSGVDEGTAQKTVDIIVNTVGIENLTGVKNALEGIPKEKRTELIAEFNSANGLDAIHGFQNLIEASHGDKNVINAVIKTHLDKGDGYNFLEKFSKTKAEKEVKVVMKVDSSEVNSKGKDNAEPITIPVKYKIEAPPKDINLPPIYRKIAFKVMDNASNSARKATEEVNKFPTAEKKIPLAVRDNASAVAKRAISVVNRFPTGLKTLTLLTIYETQGKPPSTNGFTSGGGKKHSLSGISPTVLSQNKLKSKALSMNTDLQLDITSVKPRHTQMNPLAGMQIGGASLNAGAGVNTTMVGNISGGVASPEPIYTMGNLREAIDNFRHLKSEFTYKWLTMIHKITYSTKEMGDALKYDIDILKTADFAIKRIENSVKALDLRIQRSTGSKRAGLLNLQNDELREEKRRLGAIYKQVEEAKLYYRGLASKLGVKFSKGNEVPSNLFEIETKLKKKAEEIDKKMEKEKNDKRKKKLEEEKKQNARDLKTLSEYDKYSHKQQELHNQSLEIDNKIGQNEDALRKDKITAWREFYDNLQRVVDVATKAITRDLDIISLKTKNAFGVEKLSLMDLQVNKYSEMEKQLDSTKNSYKHTAESLKANLIRDYGFKFDGDKIINFEGHLAKIRETSTMYNEVKQMASDYLDLIANKLPDVDKQIVEYNEKTRDSMRTRLELTRNIEEKITSLYKKQLDEQIKGLEKIQKLRDEDLKKRKEAYQLARKEADFQDELNKKREELKELQKKKDILSKDFSQKGQKELKRTEKEIKNKSEEITKLTNRYFDDLILKGFDEESKKGSENIRKHRDDINEKYDDVALLKLAQESLKSGKLIGINGENDQNLEQALIKYLNRYEGGLGATGSILQGELLANLNIANDTVRNFNSVLSKLDTLSYNVGGYIQGSKYREVEASKEKYSNNEINYNSPLVVVQGVRTEDIAKEIYPFIREMMDEQLKAITGNIR